MFSTIFLGITVYLMTSSFGFMLSHFLKSKTFTIAWTLGIALIPRYCTAVFDKSWRHIRCHCVPHMVLRASLSLSHLLFTTAFSGWNCDRLHFTNGLEIFKYSYGLWNSNTLPMIAQLANGRTWIQTQINGSCERRFEDLLSRGEGF